jgi:pimeloyl-ACP methyl ester carboxylesterase
MTSPSATWVLLRGWTRDAFHWGEFGDRLAAAAPGSHVLAIDLPGAGAAHALPSPWRIRAMALHVRQALRAAGVAPPYTLLAVSMGGMVATAWAAEWPDEIVAAVLVNTSMRPFSPPWQRLRPASYVRLVRALCSRGVAAERLALELTSRMHAGDAALLARWIDHRQARPVRRVDALAQLIAAARFRAPAANPFRRVLLLTGAQDELVDPRCTLALGRAWRCEVRRHPTGGHDLPLDAPDWLVTQATSFRHGPITNHRHDAPHEA